MVPITHSPGIQAPGESVTDSSMRMDIERATDGGNWSSI